MPGPYHFESQKTGCIILFHGSNLLSHPRAETKEKKIFLQTQAHVTALVHHVLLYEVYIYLVSPPSHPHPNPPPPTTTHHHYHHSMNLYFSESFGPVEYESAMLTRKSSDALSWAF